MVKIRDMRAFTVPHGLNVPTRVPLCFYFQHRVVMAPAPPGQHGEVSNFAKR